ncbi:helix-turn-helix domain-containing protein [Herbaspirillum seropedicae]|uniref:helix-turn-helix domain-containing protein n=1 Tax=Herbaspirillum seropedicae TaxID=964 RepID=UPI0028667021|nr:helix-turn-helix transcriptional regulator [Herbaspirillum seropedicae]MDR6397895.1 transcriptional regulator with XRE-family HTH domain [Herbaspirillum seropedicae]
MQKRQQEAVILGAVIKMLRLQREMTQEQLAQAGDIERTYVALVEKGRRAPSFHGLIAFAAGLQLRLSDLVLAYEDALASADHKSENVKN